jgi:hypothetical protein
MTHDTEHAPLPETVQLTEEEFAERYTTVPNHFSPEGGWTIGNGPCDFFDTHGEQGEYVRSQDLETIWTLVDGNDGDLYLINGLWMINRVGYVLTRERLPERGMVEVHIPMEREETEEEDA